MDHAYKEVWDSIQYYTQDINNIEAKDFLKPALIGYVYNDTGLPRDYVVRAVNLYFMGFSV